MGTASLRDERFLVTGAFGCIGVWVLRELLAAGAAVVAADLASDSPRLALVLNDVHDRRLGRVQLDVTDLPRLEQVLDDHRITRVIHLAALQVPFCRADPPRGAAVNVVGTVNVFEAVRRRQDWIPHVVYASSVAALDAAGASDGSERGLPGTTYGVYKQANEQMAMRYWLDHRSPSIGLRPHTVALGLSVVANIDRIFVNNGFFRNPTLWFIYKVFNLRDDDTIPRRSPSNLVSACILYVTTRLKKAASTELS